MSKPFAKKYRLIWVYGFVLAILLFILKWLELRFIIYDHAFDIYIGAIALTFTLLGIWLALKISRPKTNTVFIEKIVYQSTFNFSMDHAALAETGLSTRELEVLQLMAKGLSNKDIADELFLSLNTIKTHCSKIFEKMEVNSRMKAIEKAKRIGLIP